MFANEEDLKYREVIRTLKSLQQVKAPAGFETELMRRIYSGIYVEKRTFLEKLLMPARLIPASAAALAIIIFLLMSTLQSDNSENPLLSDPRVREDMILADGVVMNAESNKPDEENITRNENSQEIVIAEKPTDTSSYLSSGRFTASASNPELVVNKSGLNFRQINLSEEERNQLNKLKERIKTLLGDPASN